MDKKSYRSKIDVVVGILVVALNGANKTQIIFLSRLSHLMAMKYLDAVSHHRLVTYDNEKKIYRTTSKGREFLATKEKLYKFMPEFFDSDSSKFLPSNFQY